MVGLEIFSSTTDCMTFDLHNSNCRLQLDCVTPEYSVLHEDSWLVAQSNVASEIDNFFNLES